MTNYTLISLKDNLNPLLLPIIVPGVLYKIKADLTVTIDQKNYRHLIPKNSIVLCIENIITNPRSHFNDEIYQKHNIKLLTATNKICKLQFSFNLSIFTGTPSFHSWFELV